MDTEAALIAAICANKADDTPRLAYADWCEENDKPERAEFIRLQIAEHQGQFQCTKSRGPKPCYGQGPDVALCDQCEQRISALPRIQELWRNNAQEWFEIFFPFILPDSLSTRRGFVVHVRMSWEHWLIVQKAMLSQQPIEEVVITTPCTATWSERDERVTQLKSIRGAEVRTRWTVTDDDGYREMWSRSSHMSERELALSSAPHELRSEWLRSHRRTVRHSCTSGAYAQHRWPGIEFEFQVARSYQASGIEVLPRSNQRPVVMLNVAPGEQISQGDFVYSTIGGTATANPRQHGALQDADGTVRHPMMAVPIGIALESAMATRRGELALVRVQLNGPLEPAIRDRLGEPPLPLEQAQWGFDLPAGTLEQAQRIRASMLRLPPPQEQPPADHSDPPG